MRKLVLLLNLTFLRIATAGLVGIAIYQTVPPSAPAAAEFGYMSPTGAGSHNGTLGNEWSPSEAGAQGDSVRIYPLSGTYTIFDPDLTVTQPSASPESYLGSGEPQYWTYITADQIP